MNKHRIHLCNDSSNPQNRVSEQRALHPQDHLKAVEIGVELSDECLALIHGGSQNIDLNQVVSGLNQVSSGLNQVSNGLGLGNL